VVANGQQIVVNVLVDRVGDEAVGRGGIAQASTIMQILVIVNITEQ
jgi:hypothetical protein